MSFQDLVTEVRNSYTPSEAIYSIDTSWNKQSLRFNRVSKPTTDSDMLLCQELLNSVSEKRISDGTHIIDISNLENAVINKIADDIKGFLECNLKSANPKLTGLYKWYRDNCSSNMDRKIGFADDMSELYKYLFNRSDILTETDIKNGVGLLKIIYNKYRKK